MDKALLRHRLGLSEDDPVVSAASCTIHEHLFLSSFIQESVCVCVCFCAASELMGHRHNRAVTVYQLHVSHIDSNASNVN